MLASASPVFYSMFEGPFAEKGEVIIPDIEPEVFQDMLEFIYSDVSLLDKDIDDINIPGLAYASDKYMLDRLKMECIVFMKDDLDEGNVGPFLQTAIIFSLEEVKKGILKYISDNGKDCFQSKHFLSWSAECLMFILKAEKFYCKEEFMFEGIVLWAKNQCKERNIDSSDENIRNVLGDMLYLVRFPLMNRDYFTDEISCGTILSNEEILQVFKSFERHPIELFSQKPRFQKPISFCRCVVDDNENSSWKQNDEDCIDFTVSHDVKLVGVCFFGSKSYDTQHYLEISIFRIKKDDTLSTNSLCRIYDYLLSTPDNPIYRNKFEKPVPLKKNVTYRIKMIMNGPPTFRGKLFRSEITKDGITVKFMTAKSGKGWTNVRQGQIVGINLMKYDQ